MAPVLTFVAGFIMALCISVPSLQSADREVLAAEQAEERAVQELKNVCSALDVDTLDRLDLTECQ